MYTQLTNASANAPDLGFWAAKAAGYLQPLLTAALLRGWDARAAAAWIGRDRFGEAGVILRAGGMGYRAAILARLRTEPPKAREAIKAAMLACPGPVAGTAACEVAAGEQ